MVIQILIVLTILTFLPGGHDVDSLFTLCAAYSGLPGD